MPDLMKMLREFHETFGLEINEELTVDPESKELRFDLLMEETHEYVDAYSVESIIDIADALGDIVYVAFGTALSYGIDLNRVLVEIHRSNMSKLGEDGKPILRTDGKVMKGSGYFPPDLCQILGLDTDL